MCISSTTLASHVATSQGMADAFRVDAKFDHLLVLGAVKIRVLLPEAVQSSLELSITEILIVFHDLIYC